MASSRPTSAADPFGTPSMGTPALGASREALGAHGGEHEALAAPAAPFSHDQGPFATPRESGHFDPYKDTYPPTPSSPALGAGAGLLDTGRTSPYHDEPGHAGLPAGAAATAPMARVGTRGSGYAAPGAYNEKPAAPRRRKLLWLGLCLGLLLLIGLGVGLGVGLGTHHGGSGGSGKSGSGTDPSTGAKNVAKSGGDGSTVMTNNGSTFQYNNTFGGFWVWDPANPFNNSAQCNSWTKPLTEKWDFVNDRIFGCAHILCPRRRDD
jgi:glucan 1,3-beta-glucosidase